MAYPIPYRSKNAPHHLYTYDDYPARDWDYYPFKELSPHNEYDVNGYRQHMRRPRSSRHQRSRSRGAEEDSGDEQDKARVIDLVGQGKSLTVSGHIDLLVRLPLHHNMHRELLTTFRKRPGSYEGRYNDNDGSVAQVIDYGSGFLVINFHDDLTQPEMSEFLLSKGWKMLNGNAAIENGKTIIYEKWTNQHEDENYKKKVSRYPGYYGGMY